MVLKVEWTVRFLSADIAAAIISSYTSSNVPMAKVKYVSICHDELYFNGFITYEEISK